MSDEIEKPEPIPTWEPQLRADHTLNFRHAGAEEDDAEEKPAEYLRDLAERLFKLPVMYGVDQGDCDRLRRMAEEHEAMEERLSDMVRALKMPDKERRLFWLSHLWVTQGYFNRSDLVREFRISTPQASNDIQEWLATNPGAASYNASAKRYERNFKNGEGSQ